MKLCELNVYELGWELDMRGLPCDGDEDELVVRLREAMESEGLDPEIHEFEDDAVRALKRVTPVAGRNVEASSGNYDMTDFMAALIKMHQSFQERNQKMEQFTKAMNQMMEQRTQMVKEFCQEMKQFNQEMLQDMGKTVQVKQVVKEELMGTIKQFKQEMMGEIKQEEVKKVNNEVDRRIEGSEEKPLDAELDGASARVVQTVNMVESRPPTFDVTSSSGILEDQFEAATLPDDYNMVSECTEKMDAFTNGMKHPDIKGGVVLFPGETFAETVACSLTGEAALDIVKTHERIRRMELEQPNNCRAEGDSWPRGNWPGNNWLLTGAQSGHRRMRYWTCGRAGRILRDGWKRRRKKARTPSAMGRVPKEKVGRVNGKKGLSFTDVLGMDALMGRRGQVDFGRCGRVEDNGNIIDVGRMKELPAGEANRYKIRRQQIEDPDLSMMVKLRENDHRPAWGEIADGSSTLEAFWTQWHCLSIVQGCLKRIWESSDGGLEWSFVVVPGVRIAEVLGRCHGGAGCRQSVAGWCRGCEQCRAAGGPVRRSHELLQMSNVEGAIGRIPVNHRMRTRCVVRVHGRGFAEGRFVWLHSWQGTRGFSGRLQPEWEGPYREIDRMDDVICRILGELHGGSRVIHLERLALYRGGGLDPVRDEQVWAEGSVTN